MLADTETVERRAIRRLAGDRADAADVAPRLRTWFGDSVRPATGLADRIVRITASLSSPAPIPRPTQPE